ncbi:regulator of G-protein signaling 9-like [Dunckerocampus dactyliophorus]|uniref:regulator of G-protein signaling 9-like n=1 Tax=Dunckerocampus dactyliophorus TaxID=161453 RepID=UPI002407469A|nr:regulator of G-protein signaling 9-like [Dunckerocampus dactyliophorus]
MLTRCRPPHICVCCTSFCLSPCMVFCLTAVHVITNKMSTKRLICPCRHSVSLSSPTSSSVSIVDVLVSCTQRTAKSFWRKNLCRFTTPIPHLAVYSGITESPSTNASSSLSTLAQPPAWPSPISVALDSTSERRAESGGADQDGEVGAPAGENVCKSKMALSLRRLLRRGCGPSAVLASLSPKCHTAAGMSGRIQPISPGPPSQAPPRRMGNFFQIKVDIPPECRIYPIESEDEEDETRAALGAKEIICPWESLAPHNGTS